MRHGNAKIGRMAVLKSPSREGHWNKAFEASHRGRKKTEREDEIYLHAQVPVIGFYEAGLSMRRSTSLRTSRNHRIGSDPRSSDERKRTDRSKILCSQKIDFARIFSSAE